MSRWARLLLAVLAITAVLAGAWWRWRDRAAPAWPERAVAGGNVLLVTIDTLRADRLTDAAMPRLSARARAGRRFERAYAHAPLTLPSHASILTGLLPPAHGVRGNGAFRLAEAHVTLAERLRDAGYRTGAFIGAFVLDSRFGLAQGFERYESVDDDREFAADFGFVERRAPEVLAGAERWIRAGDASRPWFAWVHLFDPHAPYDPPATAGLAPYDDEAHFTDAALGSFLDRLERDGALTRTLVIVTADHGEGLGDHGERTHGLFVYDSTMHVPLVMWGPGLGTGDVGGTAAQIDLVPTVLEAVGLPPDPALPGQPLRTLGGHTDRAVYLEALDGWLTASAAPVTAIVAGGDKLIAVPVPELYDLAADPGETRNLHDEAPGRARSLADALRTIASSAAVAASGTAPRDPDAEARLRSLGYVAAGPRPLQGPFTEADDPKRVRPLYERFLAVLADGGRDLDALRAIVGERPSFDAARLAATSILIQRNRAAEAVSLLEEAGPLDGASQALAERLGAAYLAAGRADRAMAVLDRAVADPQASADAWNSLGVARAQLGRTGQARSAFLQAVGLAPASLRFRLNLVRARLDAGDRTGAFRDLAALTTEHPESADAWRMLATLRYESGNKVIAVEAWQRVLAVEPSDFDTLFNLTVTLRDLGRIDEARQAAARFVERAPRPQYDREIDMLESIIEGR